MKYYYNKQKNIIVDFFILSNDKENQFIEITPENYSEINREFIQKLYGIKIYQRKKNPQGVIFEYLYNMEPFGNLNQKYFRELTTEEKEKFINSLGSDAIKGYIQQYLIIK